MKTIVVGTYNRKFSSDPPYYDTPASGQSKGLRSAPAQMKVCSWAVITVNSSHSKLVTIENTTTKPSTIITARQLVHRNGSETVLNTNGIITVALPQVSRQQDISNVA